jgi:hypothetical protein
MTITLAWVRQNKNTTELLVASDSRLRSRGALNQTQKIFRLERGDSCLGFCGDAQVAYPLFVQVGSALNNFIRTRTRGADVTEVVDKISSVLTNLLSSWDLDAAGIGEEIADTRILFAGWSWRFRRFEIGQFVPEGSMFRYYRSKARLPYPWREKSRSLIFLGDYEREYMEMLSDVLTRRHGSQPSRGPATEVNFDYEPVEALLALLRRGRAEGTLTSIGGAPQVLKIYPFGGDLPLVVRESPAEHYLLGRKLFEWEKTTYPILDLTQDPPSFIYPLGTIPLPAALVGDNDVENEGLGLQPDVLTGQEADQERRS